MSNQAGRRQSTRAVRSTATRPQNYYARPPSNPADAAPSTEGQNAFLPALTHFADAIDALPREIIRHFSMMMEVEAKLHLPDEELAHLADQISRLPQPMRKANSQPPSADRPAQAVATTMTGQTAEEHRIPLYNQLNWSVHNMAPVLDEKIAVLSTANMELSRFIGRIESSYLHVPDEISAEARLGSTTHWALAAEKETKKSGNERTRREVAAANQFAAGAASQEADAAAARSEARREAVQARRRNHVQDSDFEERVPSRKSKGKTAKQPDGQTAVSKAGDGSAANGSNGPSKRKKPAASGQPTEKAMATVFGGQKRNAASPTPGAEGSRKKKVANGAAPAKKRIQVSDNKSQRPFSSPLIGTFNVKEAGPRVTHARGRHGSQSNNGGLQVGVSDAASSRPASSAASLPVPVTALGIVNSTVLQVTDGDETTTSAPVIESPAVPLDAPTMAADLKKEECEAEEDVQMEDGDDGVPTMTGGKAGRASKTATPVVGTFPEGLSRENNRAARAKPSAGGNGSHASSESGIGDRMNTRDKRKRMVASREPGPSRRTEAEQEKKEQGNGDEVEGEDEEGEGNDEPRYCYCNEVSYGEMVACDNDNCAKQWFHLRCVGLKDAPTSLQWYCDDCKAARRDKRSRPTSRRE